MLRKERAISRRCSDQRVAQAGNLMFECVGAHPGADFDVAVDDPFPGLKSEVALESVLQRNRFPGQRPTPGAVGS